MHMNRQNRKIYVKPNSMIRRMERQFEKAYEYGFEIGNEIKFIWIQLFSKFFRNSLDIH